VKASVEKPTYSIPQAAKLLGFNEKTLRKAIAIGTVKTLQLSSAVRISAAEIDRLLAAKS